MSYTPPITPETVWSFRTIQDAVESKDDHWIHTDSDADSDSTDDEDIIDEENKQQGPIMNFDIYVITGKPTSDVSMIAVTVASHGTKICHGTSKLIQEYNKYSFLRHYEVFICESDTEAERFMGLMRDVPDLTVHSIDICSSVMGISKTEIDTKETDVVHWSE